MNYVGGREGYVDYCNDSIMNFPDIKFFPLPLFHLGHFMIQCASLPKSGMGNDACMRNLKSSTFRGCGLWGYVLYVLVCIVYMDRGRIGAG